MQVDTLIPASPADLYVNIKSVAKTAVNRLFTRLYTLRAQEGPSAFPSPSDLARHETSRR